MAESIEDLIARVVREEIKAFNFRSRRVLDMAETREYLGVSEASIYNLISDKRLRPVNLDTRKRFDVLDLDKLIEDSK